MKTIKIFLASSEELKDERNTMADLILHLNKLFKGRGLEFELEKWEYLDASMTGKRKQDEYNEVLKQCDICMVLFWRKFGSFTGEELDTAYNRMKQNEKPYKIYVFFKNPNSDELTQELKDFIANYEKRFGGHFFCKFQNEDTMKLEFLLQLENYQKDLIGEKTIEVRNEHVYVDNEEMVDLNNLPFAAQNDGYKRMQNDLANLRDNIEKKRHDLEEKKSALERTKSELSKLPNMDSFQSIIDMAQKTVDVTENELQQYIDNKNKLEKDFEREQQNLFNTARRIIQQRGEKISERMDRAIEAFEEGDARRADIILDEAELDANQILTDLRLTKQISYQSIEELILKASVRMSNDSIPIDIRIDQTHEIYQQTTVLAKESGYPPQKMDELLRSYGSFLHHYGKYDEALIIREELLDLRMRIYGENHIKTGFTHILVALDQNEMRLLDDAISNYTIALKIIEKELGTDHIDTALIYNNIGCVYSDKKDYMTAISYYKKALYIRIKLEGEISAEVGESIHNIGNAFDDLGQYKEALEHHQRSLKIFLQHYGRDHIHTADSYNSIGCIWGHLGEPQKAIEYISIAVEIREKLLGFRHPSTLKAYFNMGIQYDSMGNNKQAFEWYNKAAQHGHLEAQYMLSWMYGAGKGVEKDYNKSLKWALLAGEKGQAGCQYILGWLYSDVFDNSKDKAIEWYTKAADQDYKKAFNALAWELHLLGRNEEALPWAKKAVYAFSEDTNNIDTLACIYEDLGRSLEALEQFELCLNFQKEQNASEDDIHETEEKIAALRKLLDSKTFC